MNYSNYSSISWGMGWPGQQRTALKAPIFPGSWELYDNCRASDQEQFGSLTLQLSLRRKKCGTLPRPTLATFIAIVNGYYDGLICRGAMG